ncbi:hypothetical protein [uncultured Aquabacterium sp.]|uniref:hypothetical protein n=1 Tax=uncultured Aquabacterium sp. TaxID=158753 RepID=UPI0026266923|nr:hypothetical protein [uncultured Aquabacterium sp.]
MLADPVDFKVQLSTIQATVLEVLPQSGLVYAVDGANRTWAVTRKASAVPLTAYQEGSPCVLTIARHRDFSLVERCELPHS